MTQDAWRLALEEGGNLALEVLASALRIQKQLKGVALPGGLRDQVQGVCDGLVAFKDEAVPEISLAAAELEEPGRGRAASTRRIYELVDRLDLALAPLHGLLGTLLKDSYKDAPHADALQVIVWYAGDLGLARGRFRGAVAGLELDDEQVSQLRHLAPRTQYDWAYWSLTCRPGCGWSGRGPESVPAGFLRPGAERRCPRCERTFDGLWRPKRVGG